MILDDIAYEIEQSLNVGAKVSPHMREKMLGWAKRLKDARLYVNDDSARLDWLQAKNATVYRSHEARHWVVVDETKRTREGQFGKDLRGAIDAARKCESGEG